MPDPANPFAKPNLAYAKLVATPTAKSWSQVYNAGNLFGCVSLTLTEENDELSLQALGKKVLDTLQTEFFTLEDKNIDTIKEVIQKSIGDVPETVDPAVCLALFKDDILYLFIVGHGRVLMRRKGKIGNLLENKAQETRLVTASGYLQNEDTIILETKQFADDMSDQTLSSALELPLPNDIAEALSPQLLANNDGGQAAIIVTYHGVGREEPAPVLADDEVEQDTQYEDTRDVEPENQHEMHEPHRENEPEDEEEYEDEEEEEEEEPRKTRKMSMPKMPGLAFLASIKEKLHLPNSQLTHKRKLFLSIAVILILLLGLSIMFTKKKEADAQLQQQFQAVYEPAQKKYEDGKALEKLNESISYDNYLEAKQLLTQNSSKFPEGSKEGKLIQELLAKVEAELSGSTPVQSVTAKETTAPENSLLAVAKANKDAKGLTQDANAVYFVTGSAIMSVDKNSGAKKELIKNNTDWSDAVGIATYQSNFYVLDRQKGIVKFVPGGGGYGASSYFKQKPDVSSARDLAIDSSVYVLLRDGSIQKYTSGESEGFKAPKLEKAMSDPAKIFTDADTSNLYILDKGNSRVIKFAKEGTAQGQYSASIIKNATEFEVNEKDKKILILSGDKVYEISL